MKPIESYFPKFKKVKTVQAILTAILLLCTVVTFISPDTKMHTLCFLCIILLIAICSCYLCLDFTFFGKIIKDSDELRKSAYIDNLTGMPNRTSCDLIFEMYGNEKSLLNVGCALITIDNLVDINASKGRDAGNQVLIDFSNILTEVSEDIGFAGRNGGNEFLLVIEDCNTHAMENFFEQLNIRLKRYNALALNDPISIRYEYILNSEWKLSRFSDIITELYHRSVFIN